MNLLARFRRALQSDDGGDGEEEEEEGDWSGSGLEEEEEEEEEVELPRTPSAVGVGHFELLHPTRCATFSPDSQVLAFGTTDNVLLFSACDGGFLQEKRVEGCGFWSVAFDHDGSLLAAAATNCSVYVWAVHGDERAELVKHTSEVNTVSWCTTDETVLASGGDDGYVRIWRRVSKRPLEFVLVQELHATVYGYVLCSSWCPDAERGSQLVVGVNRDQRGIVYDTETGKELLSLEHDHWVRGVDWPAVDGGRYIVTASYSGCAFLYDSNDGARLMTFNEGSWMNAVSYNPSGGSILTASGEAVVTWNPTSGEMVHKQPGWGARLRSCEISSSGNSVVVASDSGRCKVYNRDWEPSWSVDATVKLLYCLGLKQPTSTLCTSFSSNYLFDANAARIVLEFVGVIAPRWFVRD